MNNIIEISASLAECCIFVRLCNGYLGFKSEKMKWFKSIVFFALFAVNDVFLSQLNGFENISIALMLLIFLVYTFIFMKGKIIEKILVSVIPTTTMLPINLSVITAFGALSGNDRSASLVGGEMRIPVLFFSKALFFLVCEIIIRTKNKRSTNLTGYQWAIQISCFIISFIMTSLLWNISRTYNDSSSLFLTIFLMIAALNILLYILMNKMQRDNVTKEEYTLVKSNLEAQQKFAVETKERYIEMKTLRHDVKHYLSTAAELITDGKPEKAKSYIESVINEKINPAVVGVNTGSAVIDAVINRRLEICAEKNIEMKCLIDTQFVSENDIDVSILLSNLLDNAIEGCSCDDIPQIELVVKKKKSLTFIMVKNSITRSVLDENPKLKTSKKDKSAHGYGLRSIRNIAEKYGGSVNSLEESGCFITEIWLELEK